MDKRIRIGKAGLLMFCWVLSLASMSLSLAGSSRFSFWMRVFVPVMLIFGYLFLWQIPRVLMRWQLWAAAALFAAAVTLGASFEYTGSVRLIAEHKGKALIYFLGRVPAFMMGMALFWEAAKRGKAFTRGLPTLGYAAVIFACWLPYLAVVWPGTVSNDSITQLFEIFGVKALSNGNPLFQTGLIGLFVWIGHGIFGSADAAVALYVLVQGMLMALLLGFAVSQAAQSGAPKWLVLSSLGFYALCPIFPLFALCVGKDTNFAMAVLWLSLLVWRMVGRGSSGAWDSVWLSVSAVLCVLLRNAGAGLVAVTLLALLLFGLCKRSRVWRSALYALTCAACALFLLYAALIPALRAQPSPEAETLTVPLQQVARVAANDSLPADYADIVNAVLPVDKLKAAYNGQLSDPVKDLWNADATAAQKRAFWKAWLELGLRYPATYLSAFFHNSYGYVMPGFVSTIKPTFLLGAEGDARALDGRFNFTVNPRAEGLKTVLSRLLTYAPFRIFTAPGVYGWIVLFAFAAVLASKQGKLLLFMLPALLTLLGCLFSPVNGYFRYAMPMYFAAPPLLAACAQAIRTTERSTL